MEPTLQIKNLSIRFDTEVQRINAIDNVSFHLNKGEIVGIIGASGSGKSSLARTIMGLAAKNQTSKGQILWSNGSSTADLMKYSEEEWSSFRGKKATIVFQNPLLNLNPSASIQTHFDRLAALGESTYSRFNLQEILRKVDLEDESQNILTSFPHQLSGGQQQRVLIALAIAQNVKLLILDEPMSSLDDQNQKGIIKILRQLTTETDLSIVLISHDLSVVKLLSDRIYVLYNGVFVETGSAAQVVGEPQHDYTKALVDATSLGEKEKKVQTNASIISVSGLFHTYKKGGFLSFNKQKLLALKNITLDIEKGSIIGLVGPSGSGKSTLVKILLGIEQIQEGSVKFDKRQVLQMTKPEISQFIQMIPQNTTDALNPRMLLNQQLIEVFKSHYPGSSSYETVIESLLSDVQLDKSLLNRYPSELSGGEIQRMAIVRALIVRPQVLVLDESLSALDMLVQKEIIELILKLNQDLGMTIVMISHDHRLIQGSCDRILHLHQGQLSSM